MTELERAAIEAEVREQIRAAQRAYKREWRAKNKDKVKASNDRYWLKKISEANGIAPESK